MSDEHDDESWQPHELLSDRVLTDIGGMPVTVALVVGYLDDRGEHAIASYFDTSSPTYAHEGLVGRLLRECCDDDDE